MYRRQVCARRKRREGDVKLKKDGIDVSDEGAKEVVFVDEKSKANISRRNKFKSPIISILVNVSDRKFLRKELKKSQKLTITHNMRIRNGKICE